MLTLPENIWDLKGWGKSIFDAFFMQNLSKIALKYGMVDVINKLPLGSFFGGKIGREVVEKAMEQMNAPDAFKREVNQILEYVDIFGEDGKGTFMGVKVDFSVLYKALTNCEGWAIVAQRKAELPEEKRQAFDAMLFAMSGDEYGMGLEGFCNNLNDDIFFQDIADGLPEDMTPKQTREWALAHLIQWRTLATAWVDNEAARINLEADMMNQQRAERHSLLHPLLFLNQHPAVSMGILFLVGTLLVTLVKACSL